MNYTKQIKTQNGIITIHKPTLSDVERKKTEREIINALTRLIK